MSGKHREGEGPGDDAEDTVTFAEMTADIRSEGPQPAGAHAATAEGLDHQQRAELARRTPVPKLARTPAQWETATRAAQYLEVHLGEANAIGRAAGILGADPEAAFIERYLGAVPVTALEGQEVVCADKCGRTYQCLPEDPYFDSDKPTGGKCTACVLAEMTPEQIAYWEGLNHR
jgi:hypothetical protein